MIEDKVYYLIKDFGFPIAMCIWFMFITDRTIRKNTIALIELKSVIRERVK